MTFRALILLLFVAASGATVTDAQAKPEFDELDVRDAIRLVVPQLRARMDVRVLEPIPVRLVTPESFRSVLATSLAHLPRPRTAPTTETRTSASGPAPQTRAAEEVTAIAEHLAPHYAARLIRHQGEDTVYVVQEHIAGLLPKRGASRTARHRLLRFELARELTRMADGETVRFASTAKSARGTIASACSEAHAWWVADQLVRDARTRPNVKRAATPGADVISACVGEGLERAVRLVEKRFAAGGKTAVASLLSAPPSDWSAFPTLGRATTKVAKSTTRTAANSFQKVFGDADWVAHDERRDRTALERELGDALPSSQVRKLAGRMVSSLRRSATHKRLGRIHLTITEMQNGSAAFAYLRAMRRVVAARERRLQGDGVEVRVLSTRPWDLAGFPVLQTVTSSLGDSPVISRTAGVTGAFYIEVVGPEEAVDNKRLKALLLRIRTALDGRSPG